MRDRVPSTAERVRVLERHVKELQRLLLPVRARDLPCVCSRYAEGELCPVCRAGFRHWQSIMYRVNSGLFR